MGMFMTSIAFRRNEKTDWDAVKAEIIKYCTEENDLTHNLDQELSGYAVVSPYGENAALLAQLAPHISNLIQDCVVLATCVDSDFNILEIYQNGRCIESCSIGAVYEEEFDGIPGKPNIENWKHLLIDASQEDVLCDVLFGEEVFAEDMLRKLSDLTALPIFHDELIMGS